MTPQEAAEAYNPNDQQVVILMNQLSSAIKEVEELKRWKTEMLQLWNKLNDYIESRNDIKLGVSKVEFAIKIMKERDVLQLQLDQANDYIVTMQKNNNFSFIVNKCDCEISRMQGHVNMCFACTGDKKIECRIIK